MTYWRTTRLLTCCLLALASVPQAKAEIPSPVTPIMVDPGPDSPLALAAMSGDRAALQAMSMGKDPALAIIASSLDSRMSGDYGHSARTAESCFKQFIDVGTMPDIALVCSQIWASNALLHGDLVRWADITRSSWEQVQPQLIRVTGRTNLAVSTLETAQAIHVLSGSAAMSISTDAKNMHITLTRKGDTKGPESSYIYAEAIVNGHKITMLVDTGSQVSALSRNDASAAGITSTTGGLPVRGMSATTAGNGLGLVENLRVANLEVHHARLLVLDTDDSILGMDLLGLMGDAVRIGRSELQVLPAKAAELTSCRGDVQVLADFTGFRRWDLTFSVEIDGKTEMPVIDTGDSNYVSVFADNSPLQTSSIRVPFVRYTINETKEMSYIPGKVGIQAGQKKVQADLQILPKAEQRIPRSWTLGAGLLNDFDIVMDFKRHHACLLPSNVPTDITKTQSSRSP